MRLRLLFLPIVFTLASCSSIEQRRINVISRTTCNLEAVNATNRILFGNSRSFRLWGIKRECADDGYGLVKGQVSLSESDAINQACHNKYQTHTKEVIDKILAQGGKIVSSSPIDSTISVYRGDKLQQGNQCIGREYFVEAPQKLFAGVRSAGS